MEFTGERFVPDVHGAIELEHLHRYLLACKVIKGKVVLDIASGEGYGSYMLSKTATRVIGVDISVEAITHAKHKYASSNLSFLTGTCAAIPLADGSVDVVVSFETIEHHDEHDAMMREIKRVLRKNGSLIISCPDKLEYSDKPAYSNPHHVKELYREEFKHLLEKYFKQHSIYGQRIAYGSAIFAERDSSEIATYQLDDHLDRPYSGIPNAVYLIATASDQELPVLYSGLLEQSVSSSELAVLLKDQLAQLHSEYTHILNRLADETRQFNDRDNQYKKTIVERDQKITDFNLQLIALDKKMLGHNQWLAEHEQQMINCNKELAERNQQLAERNQQLAERNQQIADRNQYIANLHNSSSWRFTAPLRFASRQIKRIPRIIQLTIPAIKVGGGITPTIYKALKLYKLHGVMGIKRGFQYVAANAQSATLQMENETMDRKATFVLEATAELNDYLSAKSRLIFRAEDKPEISIIIIVWNSVHLTYKCLTALLAEQSIDECPAFEVIIFNNASSDATSTFLDSVDGIHVIDSNENIGFLLGCNKAAVAARGNNILLLNSDAFLRKGTLLAAYTALNSQENVGVVGGRIILPSGVLQEAGSIVWSDGSTVGYCRGEIPEFAPAMYKREVDYCSGAFLLTPTSLWHDLNGFDECYVPAYYEEVDYCLRVRQHGFVVLYEPWAVIDHFEFGSESKKGDSTKLMLANRTKLVNKHARWLEAKAHSVLNFNLLKACNVAEPRTGRLLIIDDLIPFESLGAGFPRMRILLNMAAVSGFQITFLATQKNNFTWEQIRREFDSGIEFVVDVDSNSFGNFLKSRQGFFDRILISRPGNMQIVNACFDRYPELLSPLKVIYDAEAVFSIRDMLLSKINGENKNSSIYIKAIDDEVAIGKYADTITCVSVTESLEFSKRLHVPVMVLNHAIVAATHVPSHENRFGFLFVGRLLEVDSPNRRGLAWFVKNVWPLIRVAIPNASLDVVGRVSSSHDDILADGVVVHGVIDNLSKMYGQARVFIAPIQFAAGIPIKIVEAAASGLPVVATTLMTKQLDWKSGIEIQDADAPMDLAAKSIELHENKELWASQSASALKRVELEFSNSSFKAALLSVLNDTNKAIK